MGRGNWHQQKRNPGPGTLCGCTQPLGTINNGSGHGLTQDASGFILGWDSGIQQERRGSSPTDCSQANQVKGENRDQHNPGTGEHTSGCTTTPPGQEGSGARTVERGARDFEELPGHLLAVCTSVGYVTSASLSCPLHGSKIITDSSSCSAWRRAGALQGR